ncbi:MAG: GNAT family N-acetyltransferase [Chloroflexi bacterium]|nr:GNAT family N-acetyltransferase [Chloroflexota bacterium]
MSAMAGDVRVVEEDAGALVEYARVSIAFEVASVFRVEVIEGGLGGMRLVEEAVARPFVKDYDRIEGEGPTRWAARWDLSRWGVLSAFEGDFRVAGAVVAWDTPGVDMLGGRTDVAALWDLRVQPAHRGRGIGRRLLRAAASWAAARGCSALTIETQNNNAGACRFYAREGCVLAAVDRYAYPTLPEETQLIWRLELPRR